MRYAAVSRAVPRVWALRRDVYAAVSRAVHQVSRRARSSIPRGASDLRTSYRSCMWRRLQPAPRGLGDHRSCVKDAKISAKDSKFDNWDAPS